MTVLPGQGDAALNPKGSTAVNEVLAVTGLLHVAMTRCSGRYWLLPCTVLLCGLMFPVVLADTNATVLVDGANVTIDNTVCATAAWRVSSSANHAANLQVSIAVRS